MARRKRVSRRRTPWPRLGKPIERLFTYGQDDQWSDKHARDKQYLRMLKLKEHYGIEGVSGARPWYELALAIASEFDEGLRVVDGKAPKYPRWKGVDGKILIQMVKMVRRHHRDRENVTERFCLNELVKHTEWYSRFTLAALEVRYAEAKKHFLPAKRLVTSDGRIRKTYVMNWDEETIGTYEAATKKGQRS
jgi:hypothetical protein